VRGDEAERAAQIARARRGAQADPPPEKVLPVIVGVGICLLTFLGSLYLGVHVYHWSTR